MLLDDLRQRTGLDVKRVQIGRLNFLRDTAQLRIFYEDPWTGNPSDNGDDLNETYPYDEEAHYETK